jgi:protein TonB
MVATLPETLTISLVSNNAPRVWPRIVSSPPLEVPQVARREGVQGVVWVFAVVEPDGQVSDAWIDRGILELDPTALAWVSRCRFAPCERNGQPCRFTVRVAVRFTLH